MKESEESASELFEAHSDSAMIFDLHEKAFNKMPFFVVIEIGVSSCHLCAPHDYLCRKYYTRYERFLQDVIRFLSND